MASKPLVVEARVATELLKSDVQQGAALLGNVGDAAEAVADKLEAALGKAGAKFGPWAAVADDAIAKVRNSSRDMAKEIDKLAGSIATSMQDNGSGDLGVAAAKQAVDAQKAKLNAINALETATRAMIGTEREMTNAERQYLAALQESKNQAGARLTQLSAEAGALDRLRIELMGAERGHGQVTQSSGAMRNAMRDLSFQVSDVFTGIAGGMPIMMIFSQQFGQIIGAFQMMGGEGNKFLKFLGGPWGMALSTAAVAIVPLLSQLDLFSDKVGDAVKKLKEQADSEEIARQANERFASTLPGIIAAERKLTDELNRQIYARKELVELTLANAKGQESAAQTALTQAQTRLSQAQEALKRAQSTPAVGNAMSGGFSQVERGQAKQELDDAKKAAADARSAFLDAQTNVRKAEAVQLQARARAAADPKVAAQQRIDAAKDSLTNRYLLGMANPDEYVKGYAKLEKDSADSKKSGPSADTLAKRAEAQRVKALNDDTAYSEAERAARHRLLEATGKTAASEEQRYNLLKEDINAEAAAAKRKIANDLSARKISAAEAEHLVDLAEQTRLQKNINADMARTSEDVREAADADLRALDAKIAMAKIEADMAKTAKDRRAAQLKLLDLEEQKVKDEAQKVLADPMASKADKQAANDRIAQVDATHDAKVGSINQNTQSPLEAYGARLKKTTTDMETALQSVAANGLSRLEDGLVGLISGTQSVAGAFKSMATSIIADLARIALQKALVGLLGGTSIGKFFGLSTGGKVPAYAEGGRISGAGTGTSDSILALVGGTNPILVSNGESIMNARATARYWPILDAMNKGKMPRFAGGGLVSPRVPSLNGLGRAGASSPSVTFDLRGAVMTEDLLRQMNAISERNAAVSIATAPAIAQREMADLASRRIP